MPEYIELHLMVAHVQTACGLHINAIEPLGSKYEKESSQKKFEELLMNLKSFLPFTIAGIVQRGKEIAIICNNVVLQLNLGLGSYLYYLNTYKDLNKEPFKSDGYLAFKGIKNENSGVFVLVDCRNFRHQIKITTHVPKLKLYEPLNGFWDLSRGPCVLNSNGKIKENILQAMKQDSSYFEKHSIAYVLFDNKYFNGLGTYTISEILARVLKVCPYKPWDIAGKAFTDEKFLEILITGIIIFAMEVIKYYSISFDPAVLTDIQLKEKNNFRNMCLQVYRRLRVNKTRRHVYLFTFKQGNRSCKIFVDGRHLKAEEAPSLNSLFNFAPSCEKWIRKKQVKMTDQQIGVGPQEWQLLSMKENLEQKGLEKSKHLKFQAENTILKESSINNIETSNSNKHSKNSQSIKNVTGKKRKRNGKRGKRIKIKKYISGETYNTSCDSNLNSILSTLQKDNNISKEKENIFSNFENKEDQLSSDEKEIIFEDKEEILLNENDSEDDSEDEHDHFINMINVLLSTVQKFKK